MRNALAIALDRRIVEFGAKNAYLPQWFEKLAHYVCEARGKTRIFAATTITIIIGNYLSFANYYCAQFYWC